MVARISSQLIEEDRVVAELSLLGVTYLSRLTVVKTDYPRPAEQLLADLISQPSSRVRTATIALLLAHPEYAGVLPATIGRLPSSRRLLSKLFYTAAVYLQVKYSQALQEIQHDDFQWLPDLYSSALSIPENPAIGERLNELGKLHQILTGEIANWPGTYDNVAHQFIRRRQMEIVWNQ